MTRSGEKLYGDWDKPTRSRIIDRRFWIGFVAMMLAMTVGVVWFAGLA